MCLHEGKKKSVLKPGISRTLQCHEDTVELVARELSQELKAENCVSSAKSHKHVSLSWAKPSVVIKCCVSLGALTGDVVAKSKIMFSISV